MLKEWIKCRFKALKGRIVLPLEFKNTVQKLLEIYGLTYYARMVNVRSADGVGRWRTCTLTYCAAMAKMRSTDGESR